MHSYVEALFKSIWGLHSGRAPHAVKYFFDFLDSQAEVMKITDPDVLHIWKTNRYRLGTSKAPRSMKTLLIHKSEQIRRISRDASAAFKS